MTMSEILSESTVAAIKEIVGVAFRPVQTLGAMLFDFLFTAMNNSILSAIDHPLLSAVCTIFSWFSWIILISFIPVYLSKVAFEEKRDWMVIIRCFIMSFMFIYLNQHIAKLCFYASTLVVRMFGYVGRSAGFEAVWDAIGPNSVFTKLGGAIMAVIIVIALIAFFVTSMMRVGAIYAQMMVAPFYVPFVLIGDNQKSMEWILSTVSISITYIIQYSLFYTGMVLMQYAQDIMSVFIALGLVLSTFSIPMLLQKFGYSSGVGRGFQSMSMPVTSIVSTMLRR